MSYPLAKLPPLDLVRGFVAVGRRMSITLAAQDLHVTQSAVSRQIRALEAHLGVPLLVRGFRSVSFTSEGAQLFRMADTWLSQLGDLTEQLRAPERRTPVTVTTTIGVASLWLLPRLGDFQAAHPQIDVRVAADNQVIDIDRESVDIAIRYSLRDTVPDGAVWLFGESVVPVAHPPCRRAPWMRANCSAMCCWSSTTPPGPGCNGRSGSTRAAWGECGPRACCASTSTTRSCTRRWLAMASHWGGWR